MCKQRDVIKYKAMAGGGKVLCCVWISADGFIDISPAQWTYSFGRILYGEVWLIDDVP